MVLVAIDSNSDDSGFNLEMVKQFAREKQLQLVTCSVKDRVKVQEVFQILVAKIMTSMESDKMAGTCT